MEICQVSAYKQSPFSYFGQLDSYDSDSDWQNASHIQVTSNGITMVSPRESLEDEQPNDTNTLPVNQKIFHTLPQSSSTSTSTSSDNCNDVHVIGDDLDNAGETEKVDVDSADSRRAVDLGRNMDLGFSGGRVDSMRRVEANLTVNAAFGRELGGTRVDSWTEVGKGSFRKIRVDFSTEVIDPENEERNMESANNNGEGSSRGKSPDFSTGGERKVESENNNGEGNSARNKKSLEDTDQFRYAGGHGSNSRGMEEKTERKRSLPSWANGRVGPDERVAVQVQDGTDSDSWSEDFEEIALLDLLKELEEECEEDRNLECLSLLEVAEGKGLMFTRPTSSPQE